MSRSLSSKPRVSRFGEDARGQVQRLDVVLDVRALAADVEAQPLDFELVVVRKRDQVHRLAGQRPELARQLDHRSGVGHAQPQHEAGVRRVPGDLDHFLMVVVGDERLVRIQLLERFGRLDRIGVDDAIPDEVLSLLLRQVLHVLVDGQELRDAGDVEARARLVERPHDLRGAVGLDRVVDLHARQVLPELRVVLPQHLVVDDDERRAVRLGQPKQRSSRPLVAFSDQEVLELPRDRTDRAAAG